jgi:hypothetical protein
MLFKGRDTKGRRDGRSDLLRSTFTEQSDLLRSTFTEKSDLLRSTFTEQKLEDERADGRLTAAIRCSIPLHESVTVPKINWTTNLVVIFPLFNQYPSFFNFPFHCLLYLLFRISIFHFLNLLLTVRTSLLLTAIICTCPPAEDRSISSETLAA